jgi:hypothetical protein
MENAVKLHHVTRVTKQLGQIDAICHDEAPIYHSSSLLDLASHEKRPFAKRNKKALYVIPRRNKRLKSPVELKP